MKKIILTISIIVALTSVAFIAKGKLEASSLYIAVAGAIGAFYIYTIVRDFQADARMHSIEASVANQKMLLEKAVTVLPSGAFPIELISNPKDCNKWMHFQDELKAFNAPWTLAYESLYLAFKNFLSKDDVKLKILIFYGETENQNNEYTRRLKRVEQLVKKLLIDKVNIENKILVKRVVDHESPTTTFFLSKKNGHATSILYIYPFLHEEPMLSIELNNGTAYGAMEHQFSTHWIKGKSVEVS